MTEHWSWMSGEAGEYTYSPPTRPSRPPHRPLVKLATSAHLHTIARGNFQGVIMRTAIGVLWMATAVLAGLLVSVKGDIELNQVMSHVTAHFGKSLEACREESGLTKDVMEDFKHFWSEDFEVVHRELGCAIICMSHKFSLLQDDTRMHHMNMDEYIKSFPKGEILSQHMVGMIHACEKIYDGVEDECLRVVKTAACFRRDARAAGIAPELAMIESVMEQY